MTNQERTMAKMAAGAVGFMAFLIICFMAIGINDLGYRTVVQWPSGKTFVKFDRGVYIQAFGTTDIYPDVVVFDFDRSESEGNEILDQKGIGVRYQDGGLGAVYGKSRVNLPTDETMMLKIHKEFHSVKGLANNLIKPVTEEGMNLTAGLMNSEDAYATKRAIFTNMAKDQIGKGKYKTYLKTIITTDPTSGKSVEKEVPDVVTENGQPVHYESDFRHYGLVLASIQLNDPGFESSTKAQIAKKREATMAIITAKANAEKAKQDAITTEEKGKAAVMTAKYEEEVIKAKAVVVAKRKKEVAQITAEQKVDVAKQAKLEAEQHKLKAKEIKQEQILLGQGEAERKRLVLAADGALAQKLAAAITMNRDAMQALAKRPVPQTYIAGGNGSKGGGAAGYDDEMLRAVQLMNVNTMKALNLNMKVK